MKKLLLLSLTLAFSVISTPLLFAKAAEEKTPVIDAKVKTVLKSFTESITKAKNILILGEIVTKISIEGKDEQKMSTKLTVRAARPGKFYYEAASSGPQPTIKFASDGEYLLFSVSQFPNVLEVEAPKTIDQVVQHDQVAMFSSNTDKLMALFQEDSYASMLKGVTKAEYSKSEDGKLQILKFTEEKIDWELHLTTGEQPRLQKFVADPSRGIPVQGGGKITISISVNIEKFDTQASFSADDFTFDIPEDAEIVDSLQGLFSRGEGGHDALHPVLGKKAENFTLKNIKDADVSLKDHLGKDVVILDFWATWCPPCRAALPVLSKIAQDYKNKNVVLYAIDIREDLETVQEFLEENPELKLNVLFDAEGSVAKSFGVGGIPQSVIIDKTGKIQVVHVGFDPKLEKQLPKELDAILAGKDLVTEKIEKAKKAAAEKKVKKAARRKERAAKKAAKKAEAEKTEAEAKKEETEK